MSKYIFAIVVLIVLFAGFSFLYVEHDFDFGGDNETEEKVLSEITISAKNSLDNNIRTGYRVYEDGFMSIEGNTSERGSVIERVEVNSSVRVESRNIENQTFYLDSDETYVDSQDRTSFVLRNREPGRISVSHEGLLGYANPIEMNVSSDGYYQGLNYCVEWTANILSINVPSGHKEVNFDRGEAEDYSKCYSTEEGFLEDSSHSFNVSYEQWAELTEKDYIRFLFFDTQTKDKQNVSFDEEGNDLAGENEEYMVNFTS